MEALEEFDREFPHTVTFCQLISAAEFKRQATTYTESELLRLFHTLDRDPVLAERVLRKSKQAECERRGLFSFLWAKFLSAVQGPLNQCNSMGEQEMVQRLKLLKRSILRVHLYARGAEKKRRKLQLKKPEPILLQDRSTSPCLRPTLLPPPPLPSLSPPVTTTTSVVTPSSPVYTTPRVFGPYPSLPSKPMEALDISRSEVKLHWNGLSNPKSHMIDLTPLVLNPGGFHFSCLPRHSAHELHCSCFPWASACSGCSSSEKTVVCSVKASIFTPPALCKYQPVPRPRGDSENDSEESEAPERNP